MEHHLVEHLFFRGKNQFDSQVLCFPGLPWGLDKTLIEIDLVILVSGVFASDTTVSGAILTWIIFWSVMKHNDSFHYHLMTYPFFRGN